MDNNYLLLFILVIVSTVNSYQRENDDEGSTYVTLREILKTYLVNFQTQKYYKI